MTATLPAEVRECFARYVTAEFTTVDERQQPITRPVTPTYVDGGATIDVEATPGPSPDDPRVALLFSDPSGSGVAAPAQVLVQGTAAVAENVRVRPERVFVWPEGDPGREPVVHDSHLEEVRSGHSEEPPEPHFPAAGGAVRWDERLSSLDAPDASAVVAWVGPDGFPLSIRLPVAAEPESGRIRIEALPAGLPLADGRACLAVRDLQACGDLVRLPDDTWALVPHQLV
jgi:hypothetical protein